MANSNNASQGFLTLFKAAPFEDDSKDAKKRHGFELKMNNVQDGTIKVNAVFVIDNVEARDDWVAKINEALASSKQNETDETSDPEDDVDEEKLNNRFSATQNSTIFAYMKERHDDVARKRKKNRHKLLALSAKRAKIENASEAIDESDESNEGPVKFILQARV